jgi:hypothetical protein
MFTLIPLNADCVDCLSNVDLSNKTEVITCLVTIAVGVVIRFIEKRKDRKSKND